MNLYQKRDWKALSLWTVFLVIFFKAGFKSIQSFGGTFPPALPISKYWNNNESLHWNHNIQCMLDCILKYCFYNQESKTKFTKFWFTAAGDTLPIRGWVLMWCFCGTGLPGISGVGLSESAPVFQGKLGSTLCSGNGVGLLFFQNYRNFTTVNVLSKVCDWVI